MIRATCNNFNLPPQRGGPLDSSDDRSGVVGPAVIPPLHGRVQRSRRHIAPRRASPHIARIDAACVDGGAEANSGAPWRTTPVLPPIGVTCVAPPLQQQSKQSRSTVGDHNTRATWKQKAERSDTRTASDSSTALPTACSGSVTEGDTVVPTLVREATVVLSLPVVLVPRPPPQPPLQDRIKGAARQRIAARRKHTNSSSDATQSQQQDEAPTAAAQDLITLDATHADDRSLQKKREPRPEWVSDFAVTKESEPEHHDDDAVARVTTPPPPHPHHDDDAVARVTTPPPPHPHPPRQPSPPPPPPSPPHPPPPAPLHDTGNDSDPTDDELPETMQKNQSILSEQPPLMYAAHYYPARLDPSEDCHAQTPPRRHHHQRVPPPRHEIAPQREKADSPRGKASPLHIHGGSGGFESHNISPITTAIRHQHHNYHNRNHNHQTSNSGNSNRNTKFDFDVHNGSNGFGGIRLQRCAACRPPLQRSQNATSSSCSATIEL
jgi:hypothetical protein